MFQSLHQSLAVYLYDSYPHVQYISTDSNVLNLFPDYFSPRLHGAGTNFIGPRNDNHGEKRQEIESDGRTAAETNHGGVHC